MNKKVTTQKPPEIKKRVSGKKGGTAANFGNIRELPHPAAILFGLTQNISDQKAPEGVDNIVVSEEAKSSTLTNLPLTSMTSHTSQGEQIKNLKHTTEKTFIKSKEIAPTSNFQKVPNSITKTAIPAGVFKQGKSKQLYDVLYSLTRGSIDPKRSIRISKKEIMRLAGIGSRITFDSGITHLESVGLLKQTIFSGEHAGNEFEVLLYEEALTLTSHSSQTSLTSHAQKVVRLVSLESSQTSQSSIVENKDTYEFPNTSLKTNTKNDDEKKVLSKFEKVFEVISTKLTGRGLQESEKGKWEKLAELLVMELEVAALRTEGISSVPGFLTEHLRRRLWLTDKNLYKAGLKKYKKDTVGKFEIQNEEIDGVSEVFFQESEYSPERLTKQQREAVATSMRQFINQGKKDFVLSLKNTYCKEDWTWLMNEIGG